MVMTSPFEKVAKDTRGEPGAGYMYMYVHICICIYVCVYVYVYIQYVHIIHDA